MGKIDHKNLRLWQVLILICLVVQANSSIIPTTITHETMDDLLWAIDQIFFIPKNVPGSIQIRKLLRSTFHDCMSGCDGRINL